MKKIIKPCPFCKGKITIEQVDDNFKFDCTICKLAATGFDSEESILRQFELFVDMRKEYDKVDNEK